MITDAYVLKHRHLLVKWWVLLPALPSPSLTSTQLSLAAWKSH